MSADQDAVSTSKVASALKQLTDVVTMLVDPKAKAAASGSSRFSIVPSAPEPQALAIPSSDEILNVTLTGAEIAEVAMSVCRVKNAAKHLKSNVAERLEKIAKELKDLADAEISNITGIQETNQDIIMGAHRRAQDKAGD